MATVQVRYIVHDVDVAVPFYTELSGFQLLTPLVRAGVSACAPRADGGPCE